MEPVSRSEPPTLDRPGEGPSEAPFDGASLADLESRAALVAESARWDTDTREGQPVTGPNLARWLAEADANTMGLARVVEALCRRLAEVAADPDAEVLCGRQWLDADGAAVTCERAHDPDTDPPCHGHLVGSFRVDAPGWPGHVAGPADPTSPAAQLARVRALVETPEWASAVPTPVLRAALGDDLGAQPDDAAADDEPHTFQVDPVGYGAEPSCRQCGRHRYEGGYRHTDDVDDQHQLVVPALTVEPRDPSPW